MCAAATPDDFNPEALIQTLTQHYELRFREADLPEEVIPRMVLFLERMAQVAIQLTRQEKEIRIPDTDHVIPLDGPTSTRVVELFCEGMGSALVRSVQQGVADEPSDIILQNVAQYVFDTAKQVVLSTYGQESTPELQIPEEQQLELIYQTANSALDHFIRQYEQEHGVSLLEQDEMSDEIGDLMAGESHDIDPLMASQPDEEKPVASPPPQEPETPKPSERSQAPSPQGLPAPPGGSFTPVVHEKLAAVAMLLNTLPQEQGQQIFDMFGPEQKELIRFYLDPTHVFQRLNMNAVLNQLRSLRHRLFGEDDRARPPGHTTPSTQAPVNKPSVTPSPAYRALKNLSESRPKSQLLGWVIQERDGVRHMIEQLYDDDLPVEAMLSKASAHQHQPMFPPQIEAIVSEHLQALARSS